MRWPPAMASLSTTSGTSSTSAARSRRPDAANPLQRPLDAAGVAGASAVHLAARPDAVRLGAAVLDHRRTGRAADLPDRPRGRHQPVVAITAGVLAAVPAALLPFMSQPDNFGMYMVLGGLALLLGSRAWMGDRRALMVGGLVVAVATLSRTDGVLLGIPLAIAGLVHLWRNRRTRPEAASMAGRRRGIGGRLPGRRGAVVSAPAGRVWQPDAVGGRRDPVGHELRAVVERQQSAHHRVIPGRKGQGRC